MNSSTKSQARTSGYTQCIGGESSPDEESTLKCAAAWSATDSAHSSTSELSSSEEDCVRVVEDFQWVRNSNTVAVENPTVTKTVRVAKAVTAKPPKTVPSKKPTLPKKEQSDTQEVTYCNDYVASERQNDLKKVSDQYENDSEQTNNTDYQDSRMMKPDSYQESSEPARKALPNNSPLTKLPPFDKTGSLDRRKKTTNRSSRDQKCRSSILSHCPSPRHSSPSRSVQLDYYDPRPQRTHYDSNSSLCHDYAQQPHICPCYRQELEYTKAQEEMFYNRHERQDPQRYGSSGMLSHSRHCLLGSQEMMSHCCNVPSPCWHCSSSRWRVYKGGSGDLEERIKRLESDKTQLQLQVAVLMEQVDAQADKMADQEKLLEERKRQLVGTEDLLQREMLSRSSLETQKLELLSVMSDLKLQLAALDRDNHELRRRQQTKPPVGPSARSVTVNLSAGSGHTSPTPSPVSSDNSPRRIANQHYSLEDLKEIRPPKTPPASYQRQVDHYASLPRQASANANTSAVRKGVAFGKGIVPPYLQQYQVMVGGAKRPGDRSYSTPNLGQSVPQTRPYSQAETESVVIVDRTDGSETYVEEESGLSPQQSPSLQFNKAKGIRKIFGKMKRSGSGNLDDLPGEGEFRRGGVRATAGPRLGWTSTPIATPTKQEEQRLPFVEWDCGAICAWLQEMGLECYVGDAKRWAHSGAQLLAASAHEIDKELGIKNQLHRKKLQLALLAQQDNVTAVDPDLKLASRLDTAWVLRWLDDTGLPQHKESFLAARVDGRVLHRLTMDDLATLRVTSHLHVASLRRGIQVLRSQGFEPDCLQRRSIPDDQAQVALWTNHRVMEWLRAVELSEYAPYLRGSGVHGGLIYYEPRFNAELLACLLAIPPGKTLIRRHLNTHFKELLGKDCIQEKREAEATLGYIPLTPTTKLKVVKKSQFTLKRKKSRSELEFGDLVCPLDPSMTDDAEPSPKGRGCLSGS